MMTRVEEVAPKKTAEAKTSELSIDPIWPILSRETFHTSVGYVVVRSPKDPRSHPLKPTFPPRSLPQIHWYPRLPSDGPHRWLLIEQESAPLISRGRRLL